ncbi:MAG: hypothetical protein ABFS45_05445 [Pseudomonadota bacterium]
MEKTYKRGQVEWAIWQSLDSQYAFGREPPKTFQTRIKRLLEIDRAAPEDSPRFAFSEGPPSGQGVDVSFTPFDAFCLALALDLLDMGFKQSEIVFLLRHIRPLLKNEFDWMTSRRIPLRQVALAENHPDLPSFWEGDRRLADFRLFTLIQKVELKELHPSTANAEDMNSPFIYQPVFCRGIEALDLEINRRNWSFRKALVLELSTTATLVTRFLDEAPATKRGRG